MSKRVDIPKGYCRWGFKQDEDGRVLFIICRSDAPAEPGSTTNGTWGDVEEIVGIEIANSKTALKFMERFGEVAAYLECREDNENAEQEGTGSGDHMAEE